MVRASTLVVFVALLVALGHAFDTGTHQDISAQVLANQGFGETAVQVAYLTNWFVDFHAFFAVQDARDRMVGLHMDNVYTGEHIVHYWKTLASNTKAALESITGNDTTAAQHRLMVVGASLHAVQDAYSHTNWAELNPRSDDCDCYQYRTMMSFDEQDLIDLGNEMYTGRLTDEVLEESSFEDGDTPSEYTDASGDPLLTGEEGEHGDYCYGVNHDSYNRPNFQSAQAFSYAATREWVAACRAWVNSEVNWQAMKTYVDADEDALNEDLQSLYAMSMSIKTLNSDDGHWKGAGSGDSIDFAVEFLNFYADGSSDIHSAFDDYSTGTGFLAVLADNLYEYDTTPELDMWPPIAPASIGEKAVVVRTSFAEIKETGLTQADLLATVKIGPFTFVEAVQANTDKYEEASWTSVAFLPPNATMVGIEYFLYDATVPDNPDDRLDIGGAAKGLMFSYDLETMELSGDVEGIYNNRDTLYEASTEVAAVSFYVTTYDACPANTGGFSNPTESKDSGKQICEPNPTVAFCEGETTFFQELWPVWAALTSLPIFACLGYCCYKSSKGKK